MSEALSIISFLLVVIIWVHFKAAKQDIAALKEEVAQLKGQSGGESSQASRVAKLR